MFSVKGQIVNIWGVHKYIKGHRVSVTTTHSDSAAGRQPQATRKQGDMVGVPMNCI